jgi:hypothetical protein
MLSMLEAQPYKRDGRSRRGTGACYSGRASTPGLEPHQGQAAARHSEEQIDRALDLVGEVPGLIG